MKGLYRPIKAVGGRLPSKVLGLHLEAAGELLRLYDPVARRLLPIPPEVRASHEQAVAARKQAEKALRREEKARRQAEAERLHEAEARRQAEQGRREAEAEVERLRQELAELRRRPPGSSSS